MKRKVVLVAILALIIGALVFFYGGSKVPAGQPALESLTTQNLPDVESVFNDAKADIRVVMLLSPT